MNKILLILSLALALPGCSYFQSKDAELMEQGDTSKVFDSRLGPDTKTLLKSLPKTLIGDKKNSRHSGKKEGGNN